MNRELRVNGRCFVLPVCVDSIHADAGFQSVLGHTGLEALAWWLSSNLARQVVRSTQEVIEVSMALRWKLISRWLTVYVHHLQLATEVNNQPCKVFTGAEGPNAFRSIKHLGSSFTQWFKCSNQESAQCSCLPKVKSATMHNIAEPDRVQPCLRWFCDMLQWGHIDLFGFLKHFICGPRRAPMPWNLLPQPRWSEVQVGNFVKLTRDQPVPADLLLVFSTPGGVPTIKATDSNSNSQKGLPKIQWPMITFSLQIAVFSVSCLICRFPSVWTATWKHVSRGLQDRTLNRFFLPLIVCNFCMHSENQNVSSFLQIGNPKGILIQDARGRGRSFAQSAFHNLKDKPIPTEWPYLVREARVARGGACWSLLIPPFFFLCVCVCVHCPICELPEHTGAYRNHGFHYRQGLTINWLILAGSAVSGNAQLLHISLCISISPHLLCSHQDDWFFLGPDFLEHMHLWYSIIIYQSIQPMVDMYFGWQDMITFHRSQGVLPSWTQHSWMGNPL